MNEQYERCPWAINFGSLHTRCKLETGHDKMHEGRGLEQFSYQIIKWLPGDRRSYETVVDNAHAWEGPRGELRDGKWVYP